MIQRGSREWKMMEEVVIQKCKEWMKMPKSEKSCSETEAKNSTRLII